MNDLKSKFNSYSANRFREDQKRYSEEMRKINEQKKKTNFLLQQNKNNQNRNIILTNLG